MSERLGVREISVVGNYVEPQRCGLYTTHRCAILNSHHVCPESWWDGVPMNTPMFDLCPNCHMNTHAAIDAIILKRFTSHLPAKSVALARQAFVIADAYALTPTLTL